MAKHKHAEYIKAWADGAEIESRIGMNLWRVDRSPDWLEAASYRIKPAAPAYPETTMTKYEMESAYISRGEPANDPAQVAGWRSIANAAIRHAIDTGLVAPKEAYEQCAADLRRAENTLKRLGYQDCGGELWKPPLGLTPNQRLERELAIAEEVCAATYNLLAVERHRPAFCDLKINLLSIITQVKP